MTKLTVVQMLPALESGGVERGTLEIGKFLAERGHRSIVISAGGRMVEQLVRDGSEHHTWKVGIKSPWTLRFVPRLRRFLSENRVDILHARSRMPAWVAWLAWQGMSPAHRPRFITTVHGLYSVNPYSAIMVRGERVIAVSRTVRSYILEHYPEVEPSRIELIFRGVDPEEFPFGYRPSASWSAAWRDQYPQLIGKRVLLLPGRITRLKGHEDFIRLMGWLKEEGLPAHGLVVGGAQPNKQAYLNELFRKVDSAGLRDDITFTGQRGDLKEIMASSDLVLSLSTKPESFGRTTLEALALGIPAAGYNHGGVGELLSQLFPVGCLPMGNEEELRKRVGKLLLDVDRPATPNPFTLDLMLQSTLRLYEEVIAYGLGPKQS